MASGKRIYSDFKVFSRGYMRNKFGLFFGLVFPVILILIFGAIFSEGGAGTITMCAQNQIPAKSQKAIWKQLMKPKHCK